MPLTVEAVYENGVLKPAQPLPLQEHQKVRLTIHPSADVPKARDAFQRGYSLVRWTSSLEDLDYLIDDIENDPLEGP
jgi:predicted DNA-binding antitoxin AbrB/MazE fold protein